jgi:DNA-directed RNA polymerase specialized sigma24 family protein
MRRHLIDYARGRPVAAFIPLDELDGIFRAHSPQAEQAIILDELLVQLSDVNRDLCRLVELKFFLGLTDEETADAMGVPLRTMQRMWNEARRWLFKRVESGDAHKSAGR